MTDSKPITTDDAVQLIRRAAELDTGALVPRSYARALADEIDRLRARESALRALEESDSGANATLIAAAPAMFDALRRVVLASRSEVSQSLRQAALEAIEMAGWRA